MKKRFFFLAFFISKCVFAQPQNANNFRSPELLTDNQAVFKYLNPEAKSVTVVGNWHESVFPNKFPMSKDSAGLWTVKVGPFPAEMWVYHFAVDGNAIALDPRNAHVIRDGIRYRNYFISKGQESTNYEVQNVPHGSLHVAWYNSPSLNLSRRVYVYTPAGYESSSEKFPVLYLLHGGGGATKTLGKRTVVLCIFWII